MKKDEIVEVIQNYINDDKAKYAVLISGVWGCGKTFLYKETLQKEISTLEYGKMKGRGNVYISLYGVSSIEQLSKELLNNYFLKVKLHGDNDKEKIYNKVSKVLGILSKSVTYSAEKLSVSSDIIKEINQNIDIKDMVICFDDLERCSIPINELFGFINRLVEHCESKVIILADEENIGKMYANTNIESKYLTLLMGRKLGITIDEKKQDDNAEKDLISIEELKKINEEVYSENFIYKDIKEKVIGLSLKYTPDIQNEYESIVKSIVSNKTLLKKLKTNKSTILDYMDKCDNNNIRIMRVWLQHFERIFEVVMKYYSQNEYLDEIIDRFACYSIRVV